jgi:hypothetical protein
MANKSGPVWGATIQRGKEFWKVMSGKVMHGAVLPARTAVREMSRTMEESEGHFSLSVCGLFLLLRTKHLPSQSVAIPDRSQLSL